MTLEELIPMFETVLVRNDSLVRSLESSTVFIHELSAIIDRQRAEIAQLKARLALPMASQDDKVPSQRRQGLHMPTYQILATFRRNFLPFAVPRA